MSQPPPRPNSTDAGVIASRGAAPLAPPSFGDRLGRWRAWLRDARIELLKSKTATAGAIMLTLLILTCVAAPWLNSHDPLKTNYRTRLEAPSERHLLGTDHFGRDVASRILWGGRRLLTIAFAAVAVGMLMGVPLGVLAGYFGGWTDAITMRVVDGLLAFPGILLFLLFVSLAHEWQITGVAKDAVIVLALGVAFMPENARLSRGVVLAEKQKEYVEASQMVGNSSWYTALREVLPNCVSPLIVNTTIYLGFVILIVAALSYLGLGTAPPIPDWGGDLKAAQDNMETHPLVAVFPGLTIFYTVLSFNLLGDGLRDILDPRVSDR